MALAERIAAAWLYLHYCEMTYLALLGEGVTWERDAFHRKRIEQAERRYIRAIKALAEVRRLRLPSVQVNIGDKQITSPAASRCGRDPGRRGSRGGHSLA